MQHLQSHEDDSDGSSMMEYNLEEQRNQRELFNLLYQQQMDQIEHEQQYQLQLMMQQRQYDKSRFSERQKSMEEQQKELLQRIREQENQREKLEQQLSDSLKKPKEDHPQLENTKTQTARARSTSMDSIAEIPATRSKTSRSLESELERQNRLKNSPEGLAQQGSSSKRNGSEGEPRQYELQGDAYHLIKSRADMLQSEKNALMDLNKSLQEENLTMKQMAVSLRGTGGDSLLIVQKQTKLLQGENAVLKDSVHRLNVELSRYQAKYRPVSPEEVAGSSLPSGKKAAPWLVNTKYLSPLFLAYDDRLREKDDIIKTYDEELNSFRIRINDIIKENQQLHMHQSKTDPAAFRADEWQQLQEQAKLVLEENSVLMEQQEVLEQKLKEIQKSHSVEVTKVSRKLGNMDSEKQRLELELEDERKLNAAIKKKYEKLIDDEQNKIPMKEHLQVVEEFQRVLNEFKSKSMTDSGSYLSQLEASQKEKKSMASYNADVAARNSQLERELETLRKALSRSEKRNVVLQHKLDHLTEREIAAQKTLDEVLKVAEKTAQERDQFLHLASSQRKEQEHAVTRIQQGDFVVGKLEEKLKDYKDKAGFKIARVSGKLEEKNKEMNQLKEHYEGEINNLKTLLRDKQRQLENMMGQQRHIEDELDQVWRTASADNKKMKKTVRQRNGAFDSDSDPPVNLSSDEADK